MKVMEIKGMGGCPLKQMGKTVYTLTTRIAAHGLPGRSTRSPQR